MVVKSFICNRQKPSVELPLTYSGFSAADEDDSVSRWIERKCDTPFLVLCAKPELLHVGVPGAAECIDSRAAKGWTYSAKPFESREKDVLNIFVERLILCAKVVVKQNRPWHEATITQTERHIKLTCP